MRTRRDGLDWAAHDGVELLIGVLDGRLGLPEHPHRNSQVDGRIPELSILLLCYVLQYLDADGPHYHGSGGRDGRDDLARYEFYLEVVDFFYFVVPGPQVGDAAHELDVPVCGVVFFELYGDRFLVRASWALKKELCQFLNLDLVLLVNLRILSWLLLIIDLNLYLLGYKFVRRNILGHFNNIRNILFFLYIEYSGIDVGTRLDYFHMEPVREVKSDGLWGSFEA